MLGGGDVCKHKSLSSRQVGSSSRPLPAWSSGVWSKDFQVGDGQRAWSRVDSCGWSLCSACGASQWDCLVPSQSREWAESIDQALTQDLPSEVL